MAEITKPDLSALWASGGALVAPSNSKIQQGWTAEIPPHQWENFIQNRQDNALAYLYQMGIAQWDNTTDYIANKSVVMHNGNIYTSIQNSKNVTPPNPTYWKLLLSLVTTTEHGLMSAQDKIKLNNLDTLLDTKADKDITITGVGALIGGGTLEGNRTIDASPSTKASLLRADNSVQANQVTQVSGNSTTSIMSQKAVTDALNTKSDSTTLVTELDKKADKTITISAGTGLLGGGNLESNRTLSVSYGTTSGTATQGNDSRVVNAVQTAGTGLTKSGTTLSVNYGNTAGTAAQGNDSRIVNAVPNTRTISAGTGLSGGGTLSADRTLSVNYGTTATTAARGDDSRITGAAQKSANLSDLTNKETARSNLGLGTAATRDVGPSSGQLMEVGAFGLGGLAPQLGHDITTVGGFGAWAGEESAGLEYAAHLTFPYSITNFGGQLAFNSLGKNVVSLRARVKNNGVWQGWTDLWTGHNTTVDSNGFIKRASPIIKLFSNSIEKTDHLELEEVELERVGVGHYVLRNVPLLSRDGWYIETPKDRNNNIYFYLDYDENETDKTLTIKTYEPDYSSGRAEAGEPVDILEGRYVSLRFSEDPSLYEGDEPKEEDK